MDDEQREHYRRHGYLILRGAVAVDACRTMRDAMWRALEGAHGLCRDRPDTWLERGLVTNINRRVSPGAFAAVNSPQVNAVVDALLGAGTWEPPRVRGLALPNFPERGPWRLPAQHWHLDYPVRPRQKQPFAVKLLCLIEDLAPRGGGTLLLEGSHQLVQDLADGGVSGQSGDMRRRLAGRYPWLGELFGGDVSDPGRRRRFMAAATAVGQTALKVVEFTGAAGDVLLFHPWLFHNFSANCRAVPRLQVGQNLTTQEGLSVYQPQRRAAG